MSESGGLSTSLKRAAPGHCSSRNLLYHCLPRDSDLVLTITLVPASHRAVGPVSGCGDVVSECLAPLPRVHCTQLVFPAFAAFAVVFYRGRQPHVWPSTRVAQLSFPHSKRAGACPSGAASDRCGPRGLGRTAPCVRQRVCLEVGLVWRPLNCSLDRHTFKVTFHVMSTGRKS